MDFWNFAKLGGGGGTLLKGGTLLTSVWYILKTSEGVGTCISSWISSLIRVVFH